MSKVAALEARESWEAERTGELSKMRWNTGVRRPGSKVSANKKTHTHKSPGVGQCSCQLSYRHRVLLPDLVLQETHVAIQQSVGRRQNAHRLHPCPPFHGALHRHVGKAGQAEVAAFTEVAVRREKA